MSESIEEVIFPAISLVFLLLGIILLVQILFSAFNPYERIAYLNADNLRTKIDEACSTNRPVTLDSFELPQNTPITGSLFAVLPTWMMRAGGDPNYVIYYESYPAGDAVGWEVYNPFNSRLLAPVTENYLAQNNYAASSIEGYAQKALDEYSTRKDSPVDAVVVNNIVLSEDFRSDFLLTGEKKSSGAFKTGGIVGTQTTQEKFFGFGKWESIDTKNPDAKIPTRTDNQFKFSNYLGLNNVEKTLIKYQPCGYNSLCLKTRNGVYSFPLQSCGDIKHIELLYDARSRKYVYGAIGVAAVAIAAPVLLAGGGTIAVGSDIAATAATPLFVDAATGAGLYEVTAASGEVLTVSAAESTAGTLTVNSIWSSAAPVAEAGSSTAASSGTLSWIVKTALKFPKTAASIALSGGYKLLEMLGSAFLSYKVQDLNIASPCAMKDITIKEVACSDLQCNTVVGYPIFQYDAKTQKLEKKGDHYTCATRMNYDLDTPTSGNLNGGSCIQIVTEEKADGFCWTPDPYTRDTGIFDLSDTRGIAAATGFTPVFDATSYINSVGSDVKDIFVLKPSNEEELNNFAARWERRIAWGWP